MHSKRLAQFLSAFCLLWAMGASPLGAEPIVITSGLLTVPGFSGRSMTLQGEGFSFIGSIASNANVQPFLLCFSTCEPGTTISLVTISSGGDVRGDVTYLGESFPCCNGIDRFRADGFVEFSGEAVLPPLGGDTAEVTAPFLFQGGIRPPPSTSLPSGTLMGGGLATLSLRATTPPFGPVGPGWTFQRLEYRFFEDPSVVPEPSSMLLVGSGIALLLQVRRRRAASRHEARKPADDSQTPSGPFIS